MNKGNNTKPKENSKKTLKEFINIIRFRRERERERNKNQIWQIKLLLPYLKLLKFVRKQNKNNIVNKDKKISKLIQTHLKGQKQICRVILRLYYQRARQKVITIRRNQSTYLNSYQLVSFIQN